ncbi:hypothetical protein V8D89_014966 [Ganoderma adspersum]
MRLLDTTTGQFVDRKPDTDIYSILSHTWAPEGEQSYQELRAIQQDYGSDGLRLLPSVSSRRVPSSWLLPATNSHLPQSLSIWDDPRLSPKIRLACKTAGRRGFRYIWIDSCCIDKMNSAEWSEAINSMYAWYRDAKICFAFLADIPTGSQPSARFNTSRWFTRGWTLQELIAPHNVVFLSEEWEYLGSKHSLAPFLQQITGINQDVLRHKVSLDQVSVAKRMSWASKRETTRLEDEAYSLLGIFDIHMPALYGEGRRAFRRLQEEILRRIPDQSLFAWGNAHTCPVPATLTLNPSYAAANPGQTAASTNGVREEFSPLLSLALPSSMNTCSLFATSPRDFEGSNGVNPVVDYDSFTVLSGGIEVPIHDYGLSPYGTRTQFALLSLSNKAIAHPEDHDYYIAILACTDEHYSSLGLLGRLCVVRRYDSPSYKINQLHATVFLMRFNGPCSLFVLPSRQDSQAHNLLRHIHVRTVYLPHPGRQPPPHEDKGFKFKPPRDLGDEGRVNVQFPDWALDRLRTQGYSVEVVARNRSYRAVITLSKGADMFAIAYQYWINTKLEPCGELRFIANIYIPIRRSVRHRHGRPTRHRADEGVLRLHSVVTLHAAYGQRSLHDVVVLPSMDGHGRTVALRVELDLVSAAYYHLHLSIESETTEEEEETTVTMTESGPESDDGPFVLRTGVIRFAYPEDEEDASSSYDF